MNNILELDKQRYFGGKIPAFWQFFRKAQINKTPFLHKKNYLKYLQRKMELSFLLIMK